ncbi:MULTISPECIES: nickel insertion protein [Aerococcus]|uniref:nickel insertion protein n=1 Tax=Aerococcus TaxID=1375 RepID=UPI000DCF5B9C|nr:MULTISPECIES: nickel insertion protein [Aerococcus]KAA9220528.1 LarC family nickel insertion protein [Aerococcus loyolae]KAA9266858.1 LarC family nickel insertion protein [Aerococcus loyolae]MDK6231898.1 DUF111 family protein [Aerococcus urinae]MDK6257351.1 DUF111 family protein [Aerococcus urinae]MDK6293175.1 DUF111 family protein [Aerococcus urinae]
MIECQVDDMTGEALGYLLRLLETQAEVLDVFYSPVKMKKDRPGVLITVLTPNKDKKSVAKILLKESSSFGVRYYDSERLILEREFTQVALLGGWLQLKIGYLDGKIIKVTPEYDDLVNLARDNHLALSQVYQKALAVIEEKYGSQIE